MTGQEIQIRKQIKQMGYKLKYTNNQYFIKGYPAGLSFDNLEQIENWIAQVKAKEKKEREEYESKLFLLNDKVIFPVYTKNCKKHFFECINENKSMINKNKYELERIFDKDSELYNFYIDYCIENVLSNIKSNEYCNDNLESMVYSEMEGFYFSEIKRLNADIDEEIIFDLPDYDFVGFYNDLLEDIQIEELKEHIMKIADHD